MRRIRPWLSLNEGEDDVGVSVYVTLLIPVGQLKSPRLKGIAVDAAELSLEKFSKRCWPIFTLTLCVSQALGTIWVILFDV